VGGLLPVFRVHGLQNGLPLRRDRRDCAAVYGSAQGELVIA
jgi:hypothetical protein